MMLQSIQDYCVFHNLSLDITFFSKRWGIKIDSKWFSSGWIYDEDLGTAFNEVKKLYERKK